MMSELCAMLLIFSFLFCLLFFHIGHQAAQRRSGLCNNYRASDVAEHLGRYVACTDHTSQGNDYEIIINGKNGN